MHDKEKLLSVGQMADLNCVSNKTLHVYQEKGILTPRHVDEDNGYRYYTVDQCSTLDAVTQLKTIGFSLEEIKTIIEAGSPMSLEQQLQEKMALLETERRMLAVKESLTSHLLHVCETLLNKPTCDVIKTEELPLRYALVFDIEPFGPDDPYNQRWEQAIHEVKKKLDKEQRAIELFRSPSGIIPIQNLENRSLVTTQACIFIEKELAEYLEGTTIIPGGSYLTMYMDGALDEEGNSVEYPRIVRMLDYARDHNLSINGNYIGETIANTPALAYHNRDAFFKLCLPISK